MVANNLDGTDRSTSLVNLQDTFLNRIRLDGSSLTVYLMDGSQLSGTLSEFDAYTIMLQAGEGKYLIYKHAIAHIMQSGPREFPDKRENEK